MNGEEPHTAGRYYVAYLLATIICQRLTSNALTHVAKEACSLAILPISAPSAEPPQANSSSQEKTSNSLMQTLLPGSHAD
jgi:hypothetical protein